MRKKFKNFNRSMKNAKSNVKKNQLSKRPQQQQTNKTCVYIGNLLTSELKNTEINQLINTYFNSSANSKNAVVDSIKVLKDCVYINFENKNDALNAAQFFDNYTFKNTKLQAFAINSIHLNETVSSEDNQDNYDSDFDYPNLKPNHIECEILVLNRQLKKYADTINERLSKTLFGLSTLIKYSNNDSNGEQLLTKDVLKDGFDRNLLYLICIDQSNEQYNSLNLIIFNRWRLLNSDKSSHTIKESKNIPSNKAFEVLKSDYRDYLDNIKEFYSDTNDLKSKGDSKSETPGDSVINKTLFNNVLLRIVDLPSIEIEDLDFLSSFIYKQKTKLLDKLKIQPTPTKSMITQSQTAQNNQAPVMAQLMHQNSQTPLMQTQIPSLLSQGPFFQPMQQQAAFVQPVGHFNQQQIQQQQQLPSLMSLGKQPIQQAQAPSLMSLQTNFNYSPNQSMSKNFNKNNIFKRY